LQISNCTSSDETELFGLKNKIEFFGIHARILGAPLIKSGGAYPMVTGYFDNRFAAVELF
jgi:hypothetical protein